MTGVQHILNAVRSFLGDRPNPYLSSVPASPRSIVNWVLPNKLAVGRHPKPGEGAALAQSQIQVVLSLCAPAEGTLPTDVAQHFQCVRYILPDSHYMLSLSVSQLARAVELIHESIEAQKPVYVHCLAGIQRSPTVCVAYLCRYYGLEIWEAINCVRQARRHLSLTDAHIRIVQTYLQQYGQVLVD